jgi:hypothetical protein
MVMTKTATLTRSQAAALVRSLFDQLESWFQTSQDPPASQFEKLTSDFQLVSNGALVSQNLTEHIQRIADLRKKYKSLEITGPYEEPLVCENQLACHYSYHWILHNGKEEDYDIISIVTLEGHKIKRWEQVVHEKGRDWLVKSASSKGQ